MQGKVLYHHSHRITLGYAVEINLNLGAVMEWSAIDFLMVFFKKTCIFIHTD